MIDRSTMVFAFLKVRPQRGQEYCRSVKISQQSGQSGTTACAEVCSAEAAGISAVASAASFLASARRTLVYVAFVPFLNLKLACLISTPAILISSRSPHCTARTLSLQLPSRFTGKNNMRLLVATPTHAANTAGHQAALTCSRIERGLRAGIA